MNNTIAVNYADVCHGGTATAADKRVILMTMTVLSSVLLVLLAWGLVEVKLGLLLGEESLESALMSLVFTFVALRLLSIFLCC